MDPQPQSRKRNHPHPSDGKRRSTNSSHSSPSTLPNVLTTPSLSDPTASQKLGYSAGAIIAMRLVDFQVAIDSTYKFEPYLNMILGSNGSGKSTIVTAIFLLFQGRISDLGRKTYGEFVRFGCIEGFISAQIQGFSLGGQENPIITVRIPASSGSSPQSPLPKWYINSEPVTTSELTAFVDKYHIQVNNLCQFLPQHRVSAFSGETPQQRLISTEEAVGYDGMVKDHIMLGKVGDDLLAVNSTIKELERSTTNLAKQETDLAERLRKVKQAEKNKEEHSIHVHARAIMAKQESDTLKTAIETKLQKAKSEISNFEMIAQPFKTQIDNSKKQLRECQLSRQAKSATAEEAERYIQKMLNDLNTKRLKVDDIEKQITQFESEQSRIKKNVPQFSIQLGESKLEMKKLQTDLDTWYTENSGLTLETLDDTIKTLIDKQQDLTQKKQQLDQTLETIDGDIRKCESEKDEKSKNLENLRNPKETSRNPDQLLGILKHDQGNIARCCEYLAKNKKLFEKPIQLPPILTANLVHERAPAMINTLLALPQVTKFICQTKSDQKLLLDLTKERPDLVFETSFVDNLDGRNNSASAEADADDAKFKSKMIEAGFDGVILDLIEAPEPVMNYFKSLQLNRTPFSFKPISQSMREIAKRAHVPNLIDLTTEYSFYRSKYGSRAWTESAKPVYRSAWADFMQKKNTIVKQTTLDNEIKQLQSKLQTFMANKQKYEAAYDKVQESEAQLMPVLQGAQSKRNRLTYLETKMKTAKRNLEITQLKLDKEKEKLAKIPEDAKSWASRLASALSDLREIKADENKFREALNVTQEFEKLKSLTDFHKHLVSKMSSLLTGFKSKLQETVTKLEAELQKLEQSLVTVTEGYYTAIRELEKMQKLDQGMDIANNMSIDDVERNMIQLEAQLRLVDVRGDSEVSVSAKYKEVVECLKDQQKLLNERIEVRDKLTAKVAKTRTKWESEVRKMVEKVSHDFSNMFTKIMCNGSVTLDSDETVSVKSWGIDINVAFRPNEPLARLSKQRQSGGERAISTAIYLLALQQMAKAPFRVLDEINQGMDEANERKTLNFFMEHSGKLSPDGKAQQYFLISPKIILDMPVNKRINVTFITGSKTVMDVKNMVPSIDVDLRYERLKLLNESLSKR